MNLCSLSTNDKILTFLLHILQLLVFKVNFIHTFFGTKPAHLEDAYGCIHFFDALLQLLPDQCPLLCGHVGVWQRLRSHVL